jgi:uncharacterized protein DUF6304
MLAIYQGRYCDRNGEEAITIENDGKRLRTIIRGVEFTGVKPDALEPSLDPASPAPNPFTLHRWTPDTALLCGYSIDYAVPIPLVHHDEVAEGTLLVHVELGETGERGWPEPEILQISLDFLGQVYRGTGTGGDFECELVEIQEALPDDVYMRACINCAFSDYSVYGKCTFGDMRCYRDNREAYLAVKTKREFMEIMDTFTEHVQETYLCPEFQRRKPGTGYRG